METNNHIKNYNELPERDALIRSLHIQFMNGEISQGKMADLIHLLEKMGLRVTKLGNPDSL